MPAPNLAPAVDDREAGDEVGTQGIETAEECVMVGTPADLAEFIAGGPEQAFEVNFSQRGHLAQEGKEHVLAAVRAGHRIGEGARPEKLPRDD